MCWSVVLLSVSACGPAVEEPAVPSLRRTSNSEPPLSAVSRWNPRVKSYQGVVQLTAQRPTGDSLHLQQRIAVSRTPDGLVVVQETPQDGLRRARTTRTLIREGASPTVTLRNHAGAEQDVSGIEELSSRHPRSAASRAWFGASVPGLDNVKQGADRRQGLPLLDLARAVTFYSASELATVRQRLESVYGKGVLVGDHLEFRGHTRAGDVVTRLSLSSGAIASVKVESAALGIVEQQYTYSETASGLLARTGVTIRRTPRTGAPSSLRISISDLSVSEER